MKVGVDIRDLRIAKSGAKTYLEELVREFKTYRDPYVEFIFYDAGIPVYTGRNKTLKLIEHIRYFIWKQVQLPVKLLIDRCDIVFCTDYFVPYIHLRYKTVTVFHDAFFYEYPDHYNKLWLYLFRTIGVSAAKRAFAIVTPTNYTKARLSELSGIPDQKIRVIYEGPKTFKPGKRTFRPKEKYGSYLLHVGTMEIRKNIVNLIKAYHLLVPKYPELKLILIGQFSPKTTIDDKNAIMSYISKHQLEGRVLFPGYVTDEELSLYYKDAIAYVFPSLNEGFGIPVLEAFRAKIPVLVANNSCLPEVGGDAVLTFNPYDAEDIKSKLENLLDNPDLAKTLILKGSARLAIFNWKTAATELIGLFKETAR